MNPGARLERLEKAAALNLARKKKAAPVIYRARYADDEVPDIDAGEVVREFLTEYDRGAL